MYSVCYCTYRTGTSDTHRVKNTSHPRAHSPSSHLGQGSVDAGGITDFLEAEAHIEAIKSFVAREGYPKALRDRLSSVVHDMRIHRSKTRRKDATLHRFGF